MRPFALPAEFRHIRYGTVQQRLEFNRKITEDGHWLWLGVTNNHGYGQIRIDGVAFLVHRVAYRLYKEISLDNAILVLHKPPCTIPNCFNPDHLYLGDHKQNTKDIAAMGNLGRPPKAVRDQRFLESIEKQVMDGFKDEK
jgi:hypothetical protein